MNSRRQKMDISNRAKQFMPFDALSGFREALEAKEKIVVPKMELSDEYKEELDRTMQQIQKGDMVSVIFFEKDEYIKVTGILVKIDLYDRRIQVVNKKIALSDIYAIKKADDGN